jgi:cytochrome bd-type quinol oxidase subunit 2
MRNPAYAAYLFSVLIAFVVAFQFALALGAPWGEMAMGGKCSGRLPPRMRVAALVQIVVLVFIALVVLTRAGIILDEFSSLSKSVIWAVVVFSLIGTILNTITPGKKERLLWAPVTIILLVCATYVAVS